MDVWMGPVVGSVVGSVAGGAVGVADSGLSSVESLLLADPGPGLIGVLCSLDVSRLGEDARLLVVEAWGRCEAWLAAVSRAALVAAAEPVTSVAGNRSEAEAWLRSAVGLALRVCPDAAGDQIAVARSLSGKFAGTSVALEFGDISYGHARAMVEICDQLDAETVELIEARVLPRAVGQTVAEFRRCVRRALAKAAPDVVAAAHEAAVRDRAVVVYAGEDAMATVAATMSAVDAQTVWLAVDTLAQWARDVEQPGGVVDERGIGAWRVDVLVGWANEVLANPQLPRRHGRPVQVQVVIDMATGLGLAENPCELVGYGPIPAPVGRELAADGAWRRFLVDPVDGHLLDVGKKTYRPSQRLADFIVARDRRCRFPSCTRRATHCDIDHAIPHEAGGETTRGNCGCLCRRHHRLKTFGGWLLESFDDGSCRWTTPGGRVYDVPAVRYLDTS